MGIYSRSVMRPIIRTRVAETLFTESWIVHGESDVVAVMGSVAGFHLSFPSDLTESLRNLWARCEFIGAVSSATSPLKALIA